MKKVSLFLLSLVVIFGVVINVKAEDVTLQSKIDSAKTGDTIKLDNNYTDAVTISGKDITIDLNNYSLNVTGHAITVESGAKLTLTGTGTVDATKAAILNKGGEVVVNSGSYNSTTWYTVKNMGTMTINGGTFTQGKSNSSNASLIANGWYNGQGTNANDVGVAVPTSAVAIMTINGGTFTHYTTTSTIKSDDWSKTTITDGTFTSSQGFLVQATGDVKISGGTFTGYKHIGVFNADGSEGYEPGLLNISGGIFTASYIINPYTPGTLTISGGAFTVDGMTDSTKTFTKSVTGGYYSSDPSDYKADNYVVIDNPGTTVSKDTYKYAISDSYNRVVSDDDPVTTTDVVNYNKATTTTDLVLVFNGMAKDFKELIIDGGIVATDQYEVKQGSTIITLKAAYVSTLATGSHSVKAVYNAGEVASVLNVTDTTQTQVANPNTVDNIVIYVLGLISAISGFIIISKFAIKNNN